MVVQIVVDNQVSVFVQLIPSVLVFEVNIIAGVVFAAFFAYGKEDGIVIHFGAKFIVPFLHEQHAGFGAGVRFEGVAVQSYDGEDAGAIGDEFSDVFVGGVVKAALRQDDGHASAGFEEVQIAFDEEDVASDFVLGFAVGFEGEIVLVKQAAFFDVAGKGRIGHDYVEMEVFVLAGLGSEFF